MLTFSTLELSRPLLNALEEEGYDTPTPIQAKAIPPVLEGRDLLGCAQTGTGKTAAFALPILHRLHTAPRDKSRRGGMLPRALILSPTRELATQIAESFQAYGRHSGLRGAVIFGGVSQFHQVRKLRQGIDILVATPGRLMDLMEQGYIDLSDIETFVLDEADRMLDMGFINPIREIASQLPKERQTLLFSATMPKEIKHLADSLLNNPERIAVNPVASAAPMINQMVYMVSQVEKRDLLESILTEPEVKRALVFVRTKHGADKLVKKLITAGVSATAIHGNKAQGQRQRALESFRSGHARVLVATDVAARGLDVDGITHVFNYDLPNEPEAYIHRIGRTGRAGAKGVAISFCDRSERGYLRSIVKLTGLDLTLRSDPNSQGEQQSPLQEDKSDDRSRGRRKPSRRSGGPGNGTQRPARTQSRGQGGPRSKAPGATRSKRRPNRGPNAERPGSGAGPAKRNSRPTRS